MTRRITSELGDRPSRIPCLLARFASHAARVIAVTNLSEARRGPHGFPEDDGVRVVGSEQVVALQVIAGAGGSHRDRPRRIALAYSGGLLASCMIPWLKERAPGCEVVAVTVDVGQVTEPAAITARALASGAVASVVVDARADLLRNVALPALRAGAIHERKYRLGVAMARPVIASHQVAVARREGCDTLAHGATIRSNDRGRFEQAYLALAPALRVIAPRFDWPLHSRTEAEPYAVAHGVPVTGPAGVQGGNIWQVGDGPEDGPIAAPEDVTLRFERGWPVAVNGRHHDAITLQRALNTLGTRHRLGGDARSALRLVGRAGARPAVPGGTLLMIAHRALEEATVDPATLRLKDLLAEVYADVVYNGQWFSPLREALDAFADKTQAPVTGEIRLNLYNGTAAVVGQPTDVAVPGWRAANGRPGRREAVAGYPPVPGFAEIEHVLAGQNLARLTEMVR